MFARPDASPSPPPPRPVLDPTRARVMLGSIEPARLVEWLVDGPCRHPRHLLRVLLGFDSQAAEHWLAVEAGLSLADRFEGRHAPAIGARDGRIQLRDKGRTAVSIMLGVARHPGREPLGEPLRRLRARLAAERLSDEAFGVERRALCLLCGVFPAEGGSSILDQATGTLVRCFTGPEYRLPVRPLFRRLLLGHRLHHPYRKDHDVELAVAWVERTSPVVDRAQHDAEWEALMAMEPVGSGGTRPE